MNKYKVIITEVFTEKLQSIISYIKEDKPAAASKFRRDILNKINSLSKMPLQNRQSIYFENENIRDLIFKGFTIIYEIQDNRVVVFSILKHQLHP